MLRQLLSIFVSQKDEASVFIAKKSKKIISLQSAALEAAANGVVITDTQGTIQWVNSAFTKLTGYTYNEIVGKSTRILNSGKQDKSFYQNLWNTISSGNVWGGEIIARKKDGSLYMEEQTITPVKDDNGKITSFIGIKQDITERKKLEEELTLRNQALERVNASQEETKQAMLNVMEDLGEAKALIEVEKIKDEAMLESIGEGLFVTDQAGKLVLMNKAAENLLGWKTAEILGKSAIEVIALEDENENSIPAKDRPIQIALISHKVSSSSSSSSRTFYYVCKDKTRFPVAITARPIILNNETIGTIEVFHEISKEIAVDKAKSEFVSLASHQLRTPLGIMKWYLEVLQKEDYLQKAPQQTKEYFDEIFKSNERVLSLVRDLLSVSRIEQGRVKDAPKLVNILEIITDTVTQMQILAKSKKVTLHLELKAQKLPLMYLDPLRFHEVIENLVTNAIEYTPAMGKVEVIVDENNDMVTVSIQDTGMGISAEDKSKLFDKFFRSQEAVKNNPEGSGLGLYVVKSYVEEWGGKIIVESSEGKPSSPEEKSSQGGGSTFIISLPIKKAFRKESESI